MSAATILLRRLLTARVRLQLGSGPQGVHGRFATANKLGDNSSLLTAVAITDPFVLYENYVALGVIEPDEAQLRVMKHFQKLYYRLLGYVPKGEVENKIQLILRDLEYHRFHHAEREKQKLWLHAIKWYPDPERQTRQVMKFVTDEEEIMDQGFSPQGLLVNGDVGCGKLMLMDIFAQLLPMLLKMRWHYSNFILWVFTQMHKLQQDRQFEMQLARNHGVYLDHRLPSMEREFLLFHVARQMIEKSTVLMLDEFMLPDVALAHIVRILFTYYFKLGGVLVATSNKLPEELYSQNFNKTRFAGFVGVLHARCELVDMKEGTTDYREKAANETKTRRVVTNFKDIDRWKRLVEPVLQGPSHPATLEVYGRHIEIPQTYGEGKVAYLPFDEFCGGLYAASDYILIALRFPIVVIDKVPIMTLRQRNEARRLITLIDAVYEAKCKLYLRTEAPLNQLFFPLESNYTDTTQEDLQQQEMFARTLIDTEMPYRPNVSTYDQDHTQTYVTEESDHSAEPPLAQDYTDARAFMGEDEKFAYKRAVLRLAEMVLDRWAMMDRWVPVDDTMRPWEESSELDKIAPQLGGKEGPVVAPNAPKFDEGHVWQMGSWTATNADRAKDPITKQWLKSGMKNNSEEAASPFDKKQ